MQVCRAVRLGALILGAAMAAIGTLGDYDDPWASFERAVTELRAGDVLLARGGVYNERLVLYERSGVEGRPIVLASFAGEEAILDGDRIEIEDHWGGLINVNRSDYIVIRGFTVRNSDGQGIQASYGTNLTVEDNYTLNTYSSGIMAWEVSNLVVRGNELHHGYMEGIDAKAGSKDGIIAENHVHHTRLAQGSTWTVTISTEATSMSAATPPTKTAPRAFRSARRRAA